MVEAALSAPETALENRADRRSADPCSSDLCHGVGDVAD